MSFTTLSLCVSVAVFVCSSTAAAPSFTLPNYIVVNEDVPIGSVLFTFTVTDDDSVTLSHHPTELVSISPTSGTSTFTVTVTVKSMFDRETSIRHTLRIVARDAGGNEVTKSIVIYVDDVNDNAPTFQNTPYFWYISQLLFSSLATYNQIHATDPDSGSNGTVSYSLMPAAQDRAVATEWLATFEINEFTGQVILKKQLDYTKNSFYQFMVSAKDQGIPSLTSTTSQFIGINGVQNQPPLFSDVPVKDTPPTTFNARGV